MTHNRTKLGLRSLTRGLIYEDKHSSYREALEQAYLDRVDLNGLDARHQDLRGVSLDGVQVTQADFQGSDLTGANLSEAAFDRCNFNDASLFDACFCYSDLNKCSLLEGRFGMTDFSKALIADCHFSGRSVLSVDFFTTHAFCKNTFRHEKEAFSMTRPPVVIQGLKQRAVLFDDKIILNSDLIHASRLHVETIKAYIHAMVEYKSRNSTIC